MGVRSCQPCDDCWQEFMWTQCGVQWLQDNGCYDSWGAPNANESLILKDWLNLTRNERWAEARDNGYIAERLSCRETDLRSTGRFASGRNSVLPHIKDRSSSVPLVPVGQDIIVRTREPSRTRSIRVGVGEEPVELPVPTSKDFTDVAIGISEVRTQSSAMSKQLAEILRPRVMSSARAASKTDNADSERVGSARAKTRIQLPHVNSSADEIAEIVADARPKMAALKAISALKPSSVFRAGQSGQPVRILCYGDSLTVGFSTTAGKLLPYGRHISDELEKKFNANEVYVCGLSGAQASEMAAGLHGTVTNCVKQKDQGLGSVLEMDRNFDLVLIMAGTNDLLRAKEASDIMDNIRKLHECCHSYGVKTIAMAPPKAPKKDTDQCFNAGRQELKQLLMEWAENEDQCLSVHDPMTWLSCTKAEFWDRDKLHFGADGSCLLGTELANVVANHIGTVNKATICKVATPLRIPRERRIRASSDASKR